MFDFLKSDSAPQHPGELSTVQRGWEMIKHVAGKALKWGAIGAVAGGALTWLIPGIPSTLIDSVTGFLGIHTNLKGAATYAATESALYFGSATALAAGLLALGSAGEAAETANEQSVFNYNRARAYAAQQQMMQQRYQQAGIPSTQLTQGAGLSPNVGFGMGSGQQLG